MNELEEQIKKDIKLWIFKRKEKYNTILHIVKAVKDYEEQ